MRAPFYIGPAAIVLSAGVHVGLAALLLPTIEPRQTRPPAQIAISNLDLFREASRHQSVSAERADVWDRDTRAETQTAAVADTLNADRQSADTARREDLAQASDVAASSIAEVETNRRDGAAETGAEAATVRESGEAAKSASDEASLVDLKVAAGQTDPQSTELVDQSVTTDIAAPAQGAVADNRQQAERGDDAPAAQVAPSTAPERLPSDQAETDANVQPTGVAASTAAERTDLAQQPGRAEPVASGVPEDAVQTAATSQSESAGVAASNVASQSPAGVAERPVFDAQTPVEAPQAERPSATTVTTDSRRQQASQQPVTTVSTQLPANPAAAPQADTQPVAETVASQPAATNARIQTVNRRPPASAEQDSTRPASTRPTSVQTTSVRPTATRPAATRPTGTQVAARVSTGATSASVARPANTASSAARPAAVATTTATAATTTTAAQRVQPTAAPARARPAQVARPAAVASRPNLQVAVLVENSGGTDATVPSATENLGPPAATTDGPAQPGPIRGYLAGYDGGECFVAKPTALAQFASATPAENAQDIIEVFSITIAPAESLVADINETYGFDPDVQLRLLAEAQCPVVEALEGIASLQALPIEIALETDLMTSGQSLRGSVGGPFFAEATDAETVLLVVDEDGNVHDVKRYLATDGSGGRFEIPITAIDHDGNEPALIVALSGRSSAAEFNRLMSSHNDAKTLFAALSDLANSAPEHISMAVKFFEVQ